MKNELLEGNRRGDDDDQSDPDHEANVAGAPARQLDKVRHVYMDVPNTFT